LGQIQEKTLFPSLQPNNTLIVAYLLPWEHAYWVVAQQWTSAVTLLFRLSGVMSQYNSPIR
jgi:hypothetical protein